MEVELPLPGLLVGKLLHDLRVVVTLANSWMLAFEKNPFLMSGSSEMASLGFSEAVCSSFSRLDSKEVICCLSNAGVLCGVAGRIGCR